MTSLPSTNKCNSTSIRPYISTAFSSIAGNVLLTSANWPTSGSVHTVSPPLGGNESHPPLSSPLTLHTLRTCTGAELPARNRRLWAWAMALYWKCHGFQISAHQGRNPPKSVAYSNQFRRRLPGWLKDVQVRETESYSNL